MFTATEKVFLNFRPKRSIYRRCLSRLLPLKEKTKMSSPGASQDQQKLPDSVTTQGSILAKPSPPSSQSFPCNVGWGATPEQNHPTNTSSPQAEFFILTSVDAIPIPLLSLSWYLISNLHGWKFLPCLKVPRKHWGKSSSLALPCKWLQRNSKVPNHNMSLHYLYFYIPGHKAKQLCCNFFFFFYILCKVRKSMQEFIIIYLDIKGQRAQAVGTLDITLFGQWAWRAEASSSTKQAPVQLKSNS